MQIGTVGVKRLCPSIENRQPTARRFELQQFIKALLKVAHRDIIRCLPASQHVQCDLYNDNSYINGKLHLYSIVTGSLYSAAVCVNYSLNYGQTDTGASGR